MSLTLGVVSLLTGIGLLTGYVVLVRHPTASDARVPQPEPAGASAALTASTSPDAPRDARVRAALASYLDARGEHAAIGAFDVTTGARVLYHEAVAFQSASIIKVDILAALLWRHHQRGEHLSDDEDDRAEKMIVTSDNDAANALYLAIGQDDGLAAANRALGLTHTTAGENGVWGAATTTVADQLRLLEVINSKDSPLSVNSRAYILRLMAKVSKDQRWGVPAAAPATATEVNVKNGWDTKVADGGLWIINSIGRIVEAGHVWLVVVLTNHNTSEAAGRSIVEHAARLAVDGLRGN